MYKKILMILGFLIFLACSQTVPDKKVEEITQKVPENNDTKVKVPDENTTTLVKEIVKNETVIEAEEEFIPEHIKRSHIEVVKHY